MRYILEINEEGEIFVSEDRPRKGDPLDMYKVVLYRPGKEENRTSTFLNKWSYVDFEDIKNMHYFSHPVKDYDSLEDFMTDHIEHFL